MDKQKVAKQLVKLAGTIMGPGIPDGTGPMADTSECPMTEDVPMSRRRRRRRYLRRGPQDGTGPRGDTPACPMTEATVASKLVKLSKELTSKRFGGREIRERRELLKDKLGEAIKMADSVFSSDYMEMENAEKYDKQVRGYIRFTDGLLKKIDSLKEGLRQAARLV